MNINLNYGGKLSDDAVVVVGAFGKKSQDGKKTTIDISKLSRDLKETFSATPGSQNFDGSKGNFKFFHGSQTYILFGLGEKKNFKIEQIRRFGATSAKALKEVYGEVSYHVDSLFTNLEEGTDALAQGIILSTYAFDKYLSTKANPALKTVNFYSSRKSAKAKKSLEDAISLSGSVNKARDFVNEPPNVQRSTAYAKEVEKDVKTNLKGTGVKVKILGKKELQKEKMGSFLSVNAGSAFEPQLVHLTYTPKKVTKKTKHVIMVGKGLVFDTGGYSLKPSTAMVNMKFDMAGSATVYGAFRAAALQGVNTKVTCILGITDNAVNAKATMPDSIVKARNGKTIEILNTDAEGRLVLADCLSYACDLKPDYLFNAATLTGACLVALGTEVCGVMTNDQKFCDKFMKSTKNQDEYAWQLPIVKEFSDDMKSKIADLRNIGSSRWAGTPKAAAFLQNFVTEGTPWVHLDIAGVGDSQSHLPYCPPKGASGVMVRSLVDFIKNAQ